MNQYVQSGSYVSWGSSKFCDYGWEGAFDLFNITIKILHWFLVYSLAKPVHLVIKKLNQK